MLSMTALCLTLLLSPSASPGPVPSDLTPHIDAGRAALAHQEWARALDAFDAVRPRLNEVPDRAGVMGNIALCLARLGRLRAAIAAYHQTRAWVLSDAPPTGDTADARLKRIDGYLADLSARLGRVAVRCAQHPTRLEVNTGDSGSCPATFEVDPGPVLITGYGPSGARQVMRVDAEAGRVLDVWLPSSALAPGDAVPPIDPPPSSGDAAWPWLAAGAGIGAVVALTLGVLIAHETARSPVRPLRIEE